MKLHHAIALREAYQSSSLIKPYTSSLWYAMGLCCGLLVSSLTIDQSRSKLPAHRQQVTRVVTAMG